ncbi:MAG: UDP-N-acetylglucosamine 1-carboxyvinyltransferase, partial [Calditrichaeota bacterium]|nr:UDP-N-acetylglucosamine 1-carboxyvinyltransferase [Calditrichota bacterium]
MAKFRIEGGHPLSGTIKTAGNKNAALPIIAAAALTAETCVLKNVPEIRDVHAMLNLLRNLGKTVTRVEPSVYEISGHIQGNRLTRELAGNLRASILLIGGLLPVTKEVVLPPPGGCVIGRR